MSSSPLQSMSNPPTPPTRRHSLRNSGNSGETFESRFSHMFKSPQYLPPPEPFTQCAKTYPSRNQQQCKILTSVPTANLLNLWDFRFFSWSCNVNKLSLCSCFFSVFQSPVVEVQWWNGHLHRPLHPKKRVLHLHLLRLPLCRGTLSPYEAKNLYYDDYVDYVQCLLRACCYIFVYLIFSPQVFILEQKRTIFAKRIMCRNIHSVMMSFAKKTAWEKWSINNLCSLLDLNLSFGILVKKHTQQKIKN